MMELSTNTATADTRIGSHRAVNAVISPPELQWNVNRSLHHGVEQTVPIRNGDSPVAWDHDGISPRRSHRSPVRQHAKASHGHGHQSGGLDQHFCESYGRLGLQTALGALGNTGLG